MNSLGWGTGGHQQCGAVDLNPATLAGNFDVATCPRVGDEQTRPDPEADVAAPDLHRVVDVFVRGCGEDLPRLPPQGRRPPDRPVRRIRIGDPLPVDGETRDPVQPTQRPWHVDLL